MHVLHRLLAAERVHLPQIVRGHTGYGFGDGRSHLDADSPRLIGSGLDVAGASTA